MHMGLSACVHVVPEQARRRREIPWCWSYKVVVSCLVLVLGTKLQSLASALNC